MTEGSDRFDVKYNYLAYLKEIASNLKDVNVYLASSWT